MVLRQSKIFRYLFFALIIFLALWIATTVSYAAITPTAKGTVEDPDGVNIRSEYNTECSIVGAIPQYGTVTITKEQHTKKDSTSAKYRWYYVKSSYGNGWVRADLLTVSFSSFSAKTTGNVNVRRGPSTTEYASVGIFSKGTEFDVRLLSYSTTGAKWYKFKHSDGYNRYISASYVELEEQNVAINTNFDDELAEFPTSYHSYLKALHELHPSWHFEANNLNFTWSDALDEQISNPAANTVYVNYMPAYAYKAVKEGTYDFDTGTYISFDSGSYVAASKKAVAYFMDPRNWLGEYTVFMFEKLRYNSATQLENTVKNILSDTAINPEKYSSSYMLAAENYDISPVYLSAKSKVELGSSDVMVSGGSFVYGGKTYKGYYNAYNIGAYKTSSGNAVQTGLYFAATVDSDYLGPWNTLDRAIRGGAKYIAEDFIGNNQHTIYYQHFNVANGLANVGTHPYMTAIYGPYNEAWMQATDYDDSGLLDNAFTFEIPVYKDMPSAPASEPPKGNNNCYLDSLKVYDGDTRKYFTASFDRFTSTYTLKKNIPYETDELTIKAVTNADDATVSISGNGDFVVGENKITVKVTSSAGVVKRYYIKLTKSEATTVIAPEVKVSNNASTGKPVLTWEAAPNADKYAVYRSTSKDGDYKLLKTITGCSFTNTGAVAGKSYYYKVKSIGTTGITGEAFSDPVYRTCDLPRPEVSASNVETTGKIRLKWAAIDGAKEYVVYRSTSEDGTYEKFYTTTGTSFGNTSAKAGKTYYYKVKAISEVKSAANSAYSKVVYRTCDLPQPEVKASNVASTGKVKLSWDAVEGAKAYAIYRSTSKDETYKKIYTATGTTFINTSTKAGTRYYYKVKAISEVKSAANSAYSEIKIRRCDLARPVVSIKLRSSDGKPRLTWKEVEGAEKYKVYRSTSKNGTYKLMYTTKKLTYTNTSAKAGKTYYYKVKAVHRKYSSANSAYSLKKSIKSK